MQLFLFRGEAVKSNINYFLIECLLKTGHATTSQTYVVTFHLGRGMDFMYCIFFYSLISKKRKF